VHDLPAVWQAETTTHTERKHVVRLLIKDVMVTKLEKTVRVDVRWQTQAWSTLEVARPTPAYVIPPTAPEVIERIGQLARTHIDIEIATRLNDAGYRSGQGGAFTAQYGQGAAAMPMGSRVGAHWTRRLPNGTAWRWPL